MNESTIWIEICICVSLTLIVLLSIWLGERKANCYRLVPRLNIIGGGVRYDLEQKFYFLLIIPYWKDTLKTYDIDQIELAKKHIEHLMSDNIIIN